MAFNSAGVLAERPEPLVRRVLAPNPSAMTFTGTNSYILGEGAVAVIDPGPDDALHLAALLAALRPGERVTHIFVTHAHADHVGLALRLAGAVGAPILAFGAGGFHPDLVLGHGGVVQGAGWDLRAIHTPGHRADHLCFAFGDICFSGDHVMGWSSSVVSPPEGDMGDYMASLDRLAAEPWRRLLPGHGDPVDDPAGRIAELTAHRRAREAQILAVLSAGPANPAELAQVIYIDLAPALRPMAERNVLAHLLDLEARGRVTGRAGSYRRDG